MAVFSLVKDGAATTGMGRHSSGPVHGVPDNATTGRTQLDMPCLLVRIRPLQHCQRGVVTVSPCYVAAMISGAASPT